MSHDIFATVCFALAPLGANILLLFATKYRVHVSFGLASWTRIFARSLLFTIPVAAAILVAQAWFSSPDKANLCLDRGLFVAGAYALALLLAVASVGREQVRKAAGVDLTDRYLGRSVLLMVVLAVVFHAVRASLGI